MPPDPYEGLTKALAKAGLTGQRQNRDMLIVSSQEGPVWPDRGNSFWLSHKEGRWFLSTWLPAVYMVPVDQDVLALCLACMSFGTSAMHRVPPNIITRFGLEELEDAERDRLFPA